LGLISCGTSSDWSSKLVTPSAPARVVSIRVEPNGGGAAGSPLGPRHRPPAAHAAHARNEAEQRRAQEEVIAGPEEPAAVLHEAGDGFGFRRERGVRVVERQRKEHHDVEVGEREFAPVDRERLIEAKPDDVGAAVGLDLRLGEALVAGRRAMRLHDAQIEPDPARVAQAADELAQVEVAGEIPAGVGGVLVDPAQEASVRGLGLVVGDDQQANDLSHGVPPRVDAGG
jgi:hypothetical protein